MERVGTNASGLESAAEGLRRGLIVAYPTETYYGLTVDPWQPVALERLLSLKGRDPKAPLPLILPSRDHLTALVTELPAAAEVLMDRHWPGPLTLVLPARPGLPSALVGPEGIGVRLSGHRVATDLAVLFGAPLVATSANPGGEPPAQNADHVVRCLPGVDLVVDGGPTAGGAPSTVVAVALSGATTVLRQGAIHV